MSASEDLARLMRLLEPHLGGSEISIGGSEFATFYACLAGIRRDVQALERAVAPRDPRVCIEPPWGWGNVRKLERSETT